MRTETTETHLALRADSPPSGGGTGLPEAFGRGIKPPPYEAFGRAEARAKRTDREGPPEHKGGQNGRPAARAQPERTNRPGAEEEDSEGSGAEATEEEEDEDEEPGEKSAGGGGRDSEQGDQKRDKVKRPPLYKRPAFLITAGVVLVVLIIGALLFWLWYRQFETTDDAYIDGHVTQISPQIAAPIKMLHVDDNQFVHRGDLLVELDPTDYQVALDQAMAQSAAAEGRLNQAKAQITASQAAVTQQAAEVDAAQVNLDNATRDLQRYLNVDERARSQQQLDNATTNQKNAQAQLAQAKARAAAAQANVETSQAAVKAAEGDLQTAQANVLRAKVNLGYSRIFAPSDGRITERTVENGTYVTPGQAMFSVVNPDVWVTANYKETQLRLMKAGQPVTISVDAFPDKKFQGHVDSIQAGSGSRFSLLPTENATGNFVKTVQRVPVKIVFEHGPNTADYRMLSPGLSVEPRVTVR